MTPIPPGNTTVVCLLVHVVVGRFRFYIFLYFVNPVYSRASLSTRVSSRNGKQTVRQLRISSRTLSFVIFIPNIRIEMILGLLAMLFFSKNRFKWDRIQCFSQYEHWRMSTNHCGAALREKEMVISTISLKLNSTPLIFVHTSK